jgi:hypothetical protein
MRPSISETVRNVMRSLMFIYLWYLAASTILFCVPK